MKEKQRNNLIIILYAALILAIAIILYFLIHNNYNPLPGPSAYDIAVEHGFIGTEKEWIESLKGDPGINSNSFKTYTEGEIHFTIKVNNADLYSESNKRNKAADSSDEKWIKDVPAVLILPKSYTQNGEQTPLVLVCHGVGFGVSSETWGCSKDKETNNKSSFTALMNYLVDNGYAVCDVNSYTDTFAAQSWGCPRVVQAYIKLIEYVTQNYNVEKQINLFGFSMGGLTALNFAFNNSAQIKSISLYAPITSLFDQCWNDSYGASRGWRKNIAIAYDFKNIDGVTWDTKNAVPNKSELAAWKENQANIYGYDPWARKLLTNEGYAIYSNLPPIRIWHGTNDTTVAIEQTIEFVRALNCGGNACFLRSINGETHKFVNGSNKIINHELLLWLDRFNGWNNPERSTQF